MTHLQGTRQTGATTSYKQAFPIIRAGERSVMGASLALLIPVCKDTSHFPFHWPKKITWSHGTSKNSSQCKASLKTAMRNANGLAFLLCT